MIQSARVFEIIRYYQAGIINTLFGLGLYALLVRAGVNIYAAQLIAHLLGMAFNYFTYSRHVFRAGKPAKVRFLISYTVNYILSLGALALLSSFIVNPYTSGILAAFLVSMVNYFVLRALVFRTAS